MLRRRLRYSLMLLLFGSALLTAPVRAQAVCDLSLLQEATRHYGLDFWSQAIELLEPCLPKAFETPDHRVQAHRIVALSYYELGDLDSSERWIQSMMKLNRSYLADAGDPQFFRDNVERWRPKKWHQKTWVRLGLVAVVGGTLGYFTLRPDAALLELPFPPGAPPGN